MIIDQESVDYLITKDILFGQIVDKYGWPPSWSRPRGFETLCKIILEQQVSLASGKAAFDKLSELVAVFDVHHISQLSIEDMRAATISRQKASYIIGLAKDIRSGIIDLEALERMSDEEAISVLVSIRGIGPWTAEVYLLFALQARDIFPRGDIALINTIKELWHVKDAQEAFIKSCDWSPYRSTAAYLLWHYYLAKRGRTHL